MIKGKVSLVVLLLALARATSAQDELQEILDDLQLDAGGREEQFLLSALIGKSLASKAALASAAVSGISNTATLAALTAKQHGCLDKCRNSPNFKTCVNHCREIVGLSEVKFDSTSEKNGNSGDGNRKSGRGNRDSGAAATSDDLGAADRSAQKSTCSEICRDNTLTGVFSQMFCWIQCREAEDNDNVIEKTAFCEQTCNNNRVNPVKCRRDCSSRMGLNSRMKRQSQNQWLERLLRGQVPNVGGQVPNVGGQVPNFWTSAMKELGISENPLFTMRQQQSDEYLDAMMKDLGIDEQSVLARKNNGMFQLMEKETSFEDARKTLLDVLLEKKTTKKSTRKSLLDILLSEEDSKEVTLLDILLSEEESKEETKKDKLKILLKALRKAQCPPWDPHCHDHGCPPWDPHCHDHGCPPWDHHCRHHQSSDIEVLIPRKATVGSSEGQQKKQESVQDRLRDAQQKFWCTLFHNCEEKCINKCHDRYPDDRHDDKFDVCVSMC